MHCLYISNNGCLQLPVIGRNRLRRQRPHRRHRLRIVYIERLNHRQQQRPQLQQYIGNE